MGGQDINREKRERRRKTHTHTHSGSGTDGNVLSNERANDYVRFIWIESNNRECSLVCFVCFYMLGSLLSLPFSLWRYSFFLFFSFFSSSTVSAFCLFLPFLSSSSLCLTSFDFLSLFHSSSFISFLLSPHCPVVVSSPLRLLVYSFDRSSRCHRSLQLEFLAFTFFLSLFLSHTLSFTCACLFSTCHCCSHLFFLLIHSFGSRDAF